MATYPEIRALFGNDDLRGKIEVAVIIAAESIRVEDPQPPNHASRLTWAKATWGNPEPIAKRMLMALLAANKDLEVGDAETPGTILGATPAQIQAKVDAAVNVFADGS